MIRDRRAILALLTALNTLNYIDRMVVAAVLKPMKDDLQLSNFEAGLLTTAFLIGYFVTSPWFGARADKGARKGLITLGIVIWSLATVASGLCHEFWTLMAARAVVGVGEASLVALAPTIIDDITPGERKGRALAIFYLGMPIGYALGYILGGTIAKHWGWREAFFFTGGPGVVIALSVLWIEEPARKLADAKARLIDGLREIARLPLFRRAVLGYCVFTGAVGAFTAWAPKFLIEHFEHTTSKLDEQSANVYFGGVLLIAGAIGTVLGGQWMDRKLRRLPAPAPGAPFDAPEYKAQINVMLWLSALGIAVAAPLTAVSFLLPTPTAFFVVAFVVMIGVFLSTSPVNAALLRAVPEERRASAMAANVFAIHLLGDVWSPPALGLLQDNLPLTLAMMALPLAFAWAAYVWWPRRREAMGQLPEARVREAT